MDSMSYRNNRPAPKPSEPAAAAPAPHQTHSATPVRTKRSEPAKRSKKPLVLGLAILIAIALAAVAWFFFGRGSVATAIDGSKYQAVVLRDALSTPTYFGKLSVISDDYFRLTDVYYLQKKSDSTAASPQSVENQSASDFELIKLGNEIHGPEDEIIISKSQLLYFENLKPGGTVSKTISQSQTKN